MRLSVTCDESNASPIEGSATFATDRFRFATPATRISVTRTMPARSGASARNSDPATWRFHQMGGRTALRIGLRAPVRRENQKRRLGMEEIGPVEYMIVSFPGNRFTGEIAPALGKLVESNTIRIIDLAFASKDADGNVPAFELSDIDEKVRRGLEALGL